ncbi:hypothetical protein X759_20585 [Mesorhizobium sp. LSHC420B00]|nr:hypothetical protein X759_20585 [Mesorhizobium sp. LSHC420B00]
MDHASRVLPIIDIGGTAPGADPPAVGSAPLYRFAATLRNPRVGAPFREAMKAA